MPDHDLGPFISATKSGKTLHLSRDPDPHTAAYFVVEAEGMLVLFPERDPLTSAAPAPSVPARHDSTDRNAQLRNAFAALTSRVPESGWSRSNDPHAHLKAGFEALHTQPAVVEDVAAYLRSNPSVASAAEMLFTSLAMSARANWRAVPEPHRAVAARGWFLGRWVPTFLVLDGPILRFLNSAAFKLQENQGEFLRSVRSFFHARHFMALRHAFAHWSFSWVFNGEDSEIVATHDSLEIRVSRKE